MECSFCEKRAVYFQAYSGKYFCAGCFKSKLEKKVMRTISKYKMLSYGDKIAVMVSGGKDSLSLLRILNKLSRRQGSELIAITIDEGISGYREEALSLARELAESISVGHRVVSFKGLFGYTLDELVRKEGRKGCMVCGTLRRRAMEVAAKQVGAAVIATAHNLDDLIQTFIINLMSNDIKRIRWIYPVRTSKVIGSKRVKPFAEIYEEEISLYAYLSGIKFQTSVCPYMGESIRLPIREFLNKMEADHPGIKYSIYKTAMNVCKNLVIKEETPKRCTVCGYPSVSDVCLTCGILKEVVVPS